MDAILDDATIHQRRQTLLKMTDGFGLDDAYSTTLDRIREQRGNRVRLGMEALMWISCSERPLKVAELCDALAVEVGTVDLNAHHAPSIQTLLSCTLGLITIDEQSSIVRLVHFTLQEYLAAHDSLFTTPHSMMAEICLTYLNFQSVCELPTAPGSIPSTMPFLHYSSCHWGSHARKDVIERVKLLALQLLQQDANHISAHILLRERAVDFLSWEDRYYGRHPDLQGYTGLHCIAYMGIAEIAIAMVDMKVWDLNQRDSKGATPFIWAVKYGNSMLAKLLFEQGDFNPTLSDKGGLTPLSYAARSGDEGIVKILLERGDVSSDSPCGDGRTPLSYAAQYGHDGIVKILLERADVNPDSSDESGQTPLSYAAQYGHDGIVKILLERADVNPDSSDKYGRTPLSYAAQYGHDGIVKILLERADVNPDSSDKYGRTPLSYAAQSGHDGIVKILLERADVNPDSSGESGRTPLSYAAQSGRDGIVKILLGRADVNPDSSDKSGRTPLSYAAESGHDGIVKLLLERADVNPGSSDASSRTPLDYARDFERTGVIKLLSDQRPSVHKTPHNRGLMPKVSSPAPSAQEEAESSPLSQHAAIIPETRHEITEATPLSPPDLSPSNQLETLLPASTPSPIPKPHAAPDSAISGPSRSLKRSITEIPHSLRRVRQKLSPPP